MSSSFFVDEDDSDSSVNNVSSRSNSTKTTDTDHGNGTTINTSTSSLAATETNAVERSKRVLLAFMLLTAVGLATGTYFFLWEEETQDFQSKFHDMDIEVMNVVHHEAVNVYKAVKALTESITSFAGATQSEWPRITMPDFEARGNVINELANSLVVCFAPFVSQTQRMGWENYSVENQGWVKDAYVFSHSDDDEFAILFNPERIPEHIHRLENGTAMVKEDGPGPFLPVWQMARAPVVPSIINFNLLSHPVFARITHGMEETKHPVMSEVTDLYWLYEKAVQDDVTHPHSFLLYPVFERIASTEAESGRIVGAVVAVLPWDHYLQNILANDQAGFVVVFTDTCGDSFTYEVNGPDATFVGYGDHHDPKYDRMETITDFAPFEQLDFSETHEHCEYALHMYPSQALENDVRTNTPLICAGLIVLVFAATISVFILYDLLVQRRQQRLATMARKANAVVSSLFPANVRDRILEEADHNEVEGGRNHNFSYKVPKHQLKNFLDNGINSKKDAATVYDGKPIADLFPEATIMFADIAGFTAWSSEREPSQVFQLLETLYNHFDECAARRRVFKVETIGDCYVAVTGLPNPRHDHAVVMTRFARDILTLMNDLTKRLEVELGPGTGDLSLRVGLHSGPVTAGVLRGDRARFQLFGDTVNTASRMESTGIPNRIQASEETAQSLRKQGKECWLKPRSEKIVAKGKGELQTYWIDLKAPSGPSTQSDGTTSSTTEEETSTILSSSAEDAAAAAAANNHKQKKEKSGEERKQRRSKNHSLKNSSTKDSLPQPQQQEPLSDMLSPTSKRLVKWNSEMLLRLLKQVVARRKSIFALEKEGGKNNHHHFRGGGQQQQEQQEVPTFIRDTNVQTVIHEVKEIITLPRFNARAARNQEDIKHIHLPPNVVEQLKEFVTIIACMYRPNPFHNFEHASHVTMSVIKLLSRIVAPDDVLKETAGVDDHDINMKLHDHTYGITSDPLTQFAVVMSALIHDVDHTGVPNTQLVKEKASVALFYNNKSVAEQNSVDLAWELLFDDSFQDLRETIAPTKSEMTRFRQLVVNSVMATDITDKDMKKLRNDRWDKAFQQTTTTTSTNAEDPTQDVINRKATIVIEHLIQASDVAHTMQHWHIYLRWNERFFEENMKAFREGRAGAKNPLEFWYQGELGFFDFYIIPLAKKLKDCGVFGVSSDEYLNYATRNRQEWEERGQQIVEDYKKKYWEQDSSSTTTGVRQK